MTEQTTFDTLDLNNEQTDEPHPDDVLGEHTYENALYNPSTDKPVNIITGETPAHSQATIDDAKNYAEQLTRKHDTPYVAKSTPVESQIETQSKPYSGAVFYHFSIVGGMDKHDAFAAAWDDDDYHIEHTTDYTTGTLTITVTKTNSE